MQTVDYILKVPKEMKEVIDLIDGIAGKLVAKAELASYTDLLDEAMVAIEGIQHVGEEVKSEYRDEIAAYLVHKLMATLMPVEVIVDPAPAPA